MSYTILQFICVLILKSNLVGALAEIKRVKEATGCILRQGSEILIHVYVVEAGMDRVGAIAV